MMRHFITATLVVAGLATTASAATSFVGSRGALAGTDSIDWGQFGATFTGVSNPAAGTTTGALGFTVAMPGSTFTRLDQGNGWTGNYGAGDELLWTSFASGPMRIDFASAVSSVGAQIQRNTYGAFVGSIEVFDSSNVSLGSFTANGSSNGAGDNSAIFLGIASTLTDIWAVEFNVDNGSDFSINQVDLNGNVRVVPLPTGAGLAFVGMGILGFRRNRR